MVKGGGVDRGGTVGTVTVAIAEALEPAHMKYTITYKQTIALGKRPRQIRKIFSVYRNKKPTTEQILDLVRDNSGVNFDRKSIKMTY